MEHLYGNKGYKIMYGGNTELDNGEIKSWIGISIFDNRSDRRLAKCIIDYTFKKNGDLVINYLEETDIVTTKVEQFRFYFVFPLMKLFKKLGKENKILCSECNSSQLLEALGPCIIETNGSLIINEEKVKIIIGMINVLEKSPVVWEVKDIDRLIDFRTKGKRIRLIWVSEKNVFGLFFSEQPYMDVAKCKEYVDTIEKLERTLDRLELEDAFVPALLEKIDNIFETNLWKNKKRDTKSDNLKKFYVQLEKFDSLESIERTLEYIETKEEFIYDKKITSYIFPKFVIAELETNHFGVKLIIENKEDIEDTILHCLKKDIEKEILEKINEVR